MISAAAIRKDSLENSQSDISVTASSAPEIFVSNGFPFENATFSSTVSLEPRHEANPMMAVFSEEVLKMWLGSDLNHVSISSNKGETTIRVINEQTGSVKVADMLKLDQSPKSIAVSPNGKDFLLVLEEGVFQYTVAPSGKLTTTFAYVADTGREVLAARYDDQAGVKISTRKL